MMFPFLKKAITNAFTKPSTEAFPCPEGEGLGNYRGRIAFDGEKCIDCGMCIKVCSPAAIELEREEEKRALERGQVVPVEEVLKAAEAAIAAFSAALDKGESDAVDDIARRTR